MRGEGGDKNDKMAFYWLTLATSQQVKDADFLRDRAAKKLSGSEIEALEAEAAAFQPE